MCLSSSCVPDSFLCGSVTSLLKKGKYPVSCSSYRPITVACTLSKLFEHILLPYITKLALNDDNQFCFRSGLGCQHAHRALTSLLKDSHRTRRVLHFAILDLPKHLTVFVILKHGQHYAREE